MRDHIRPTKAELTSGRYQFGARPLGLVDERGRTFVMRFELGEAMNTLATEVARLARQVLDDIGSRGDDTKKNAKEDGGRGVQESATVGITRPYKQVSPSRVWVAGEGRQKGGGTER